MSEEYSRLPVEAMPMPIGVVVDSMALEDEEDNGMGNETTLGDEELEEPSEEDLKAEDELFVDDEPDNA
jgi:hypothetical protein